jgi:hypothetical protein
MDMDISSPLAIFLRISEVEAERARARLMASHYAGLRLTSLAAPWKALFKRLTARRDALKARLP